jgi:nitroreductase
VSEAGGLDIFAVMGAQRAVRLFRPEPVPSALIRQILEAAVKAPNGSNWQVWRFLVVTDPELRTRIGALYRESYIANLPRVPDATLEARGGREATILSEHFGEAPVHIVICDVPREDLLHVPGAVLMLGASIYPACQNIMLAATALGLGSVLTTVWRHRAMVLKDLLGVPAEYEIGAIIPLGWPARDYGPPLRRPAAEVAFGDRWGQPFAGDDTQRALQSGSGTGVS